MEEFHFTGEPAVQAFPQSGQTHFFRFFIGLRDRPFVLQEMTHLSICTDQVSDNCDRCCLKASRDFFVLMEYSTNDSCWWLRFDDCIVEMLDGLYSGACNDSLRGGSTRGGGF